ncbi:MAG: DNA adenine methylase [Bacteroidia bacterium]
MKLPHPIPYQGSKRNLAGQILRMFPDYFHNLIEPFAGSAAITIASAYYFKANHFIINDINQPLINLWDTIINNPKSMVKSYHDIWHGQLGNEEEYYYQIRNRFNETKQPEYLLFLLAKCVKAAVRYNSQGDFNQSPDKRRLGRNPSLMRDDILRVSQLLKGKVQLHSVDYQKLLTLATADDLVYMDPPYQGTGINGGFNYAGNIEFDNFVTSLFELNNNNIPYILSYDGRTGDKTYGNPLPENLNLIKVEIDAGRSSQATLLNRSEITYEAVYLSPALVSKIDLQKVTGKQNCQTELFAS